MDDEENKRMEFVIKTTVKMQIYMHEAIVAAFDNHEDRSAVLYSMMVNFVTKTMYDISPTENVVENLTEVITGLQDWVAGFGTKMIKYNLATNEFKKEDLH